MSAGILTAVYSNGLVHAGWTNVTYQVQLQKIGASNDFYTATNRPHKASYYAYSVRPTLGTVTNAYNDQGTALMENQCEMFYSNEWASSTGNPVWIIGDLTTPPAAAPEVSTNAVEGSTGSGFLISPALKAVAEWQFQYCTNIIW